MFGVIWWRILYMLRHVSQHRLSEGRTPVSSLSDFILCNVAPSFFFHQALILRRGLRTHTHTHAPDNSWHIACLSSEKGEDYFWWWANQGGNCCLYMSVKRARIINTCLLLGMLRQFDLGSLTCKRRIRLDGGELEGHLMLVPVDDQMLLRLEALQHTDRVRKTWRDGCSCMTRHMGWDVGLNQLTPLTAD